MIQETMLRKLEFMWGLPILYTKDAGEELKSTGRHMKEGTPLAECPQLVSELIERQRHQELPVVMAAADKFYFFCMRVDEGFYLSGPFSPEKLTYIEIHQFYKQYRLHVKEEEHPRLISNFEALNFVSLLYEIAVGDHADPSALASVNRLTEDRETREKHRNAEMADFELRRIEDDAYHHTYRDERFVLECVREGNVAEARERAGWLIDSAGTMSANAMTQQRYLCVVTVTLCTRESIAGGAAPADAYRMSDYLLQQLESLKTYPELTEFITQAIVAFAELTSAVNATADSSYTEQVKHYVAQNYHHKIYVQEIADVLGLSQGHLSRVFQAETGMRIRDYILKYRVERAANLLKYTELSIAEIASYVCFQSQSHFGSVFKKYMGMTPGEYRAKGLKG